MENDEQAILAKFLLKRLREVSRELNVHRAVLENFKLFVPEETLQEWMALYRESPEIRSVTEKRFAAFDDIVERLGKSPLDREALELLQKWSPGDEDKPN